MNAAMFSYVIKVGQCQVAFKIPNPIHFITVHFYFRLFSDYTFFRSNLISSDPKKTKQKFHEDVVHTLDCIRNCTKKNTIRACIYSLKTKVRVSTQKRWFIYRQKCWNSENEQQRFHSDGVSTLGHIRSWIDQHSKQKGIILFLH